MTKKRVLITGGAGFIAHHVIYHIIKNTNWDIVSIDRLDFSGNLNRLSDLMNDLKPNEKKRVKIVYHDLRAEVNSMLDQLQILFHLFLIMLLRPATS